MEIDQARVRVEELRREIDRANAAYYSGQTPIISEVVQRLAHFASRGAMDITGLGERTVQALVAAREVGDPGDIFTLDEERLLRLDRMGPKTARYLLRALEAARSRPLARLVYGPRHPPRGGDGGGHPRPRLPPARIAGHGERGGAPRGPWNRSGRRPERPQLLPEPRHANGDREAASDRRPPRRRGARPWTAAAGREDLVITGAFQGYSRDGLERLLADLGAKVASSVSRRTDYVIAGDKPGTKLERARELGRPILDEAGLQRLLREAEGL